MHTWIVLLFILATLASGLLAGISVDKSLVQLPARHTMGLVAFAAFSRAADLGRGLIWYPLFGIGAPVVMLVGCFLQVSQRVALEQAILLMLAVLVNVAHVFTTSRAAPMLVRLRQGIPDKDRKSVV